MGWRAPEDIASDFAWCVARMVEDGTIVMGDERYTALVTGWNEMYQSFMVGVRAFKELAEHADAMAQAIHDDPNASAESIVARTAFDVLIAGGT